MIMPQYHIGNDTNNKYELSHFDTRAP